MIEPTTLTEKELRKRLKQNDQALKSGQPFIWCTVCFHDRHGSWSTPKLVTPCTEDGCLCGTPCSALLDSQRIDVPDGEQAYNLRIERGEAIVTWQGQEYMVTVPRTGRYCFAVELGRGRPRLTIHAE